MIGLTLGTEKSLYSIKEDGGSLEVCIDALLGTISSSDTYTVSYTTVDDAAEGIIADPCEKTCALTSENK